MEYAYKPLFTVSVEHGYFVDGLWQRLVFEPTGATRRLMDRNGLLLRQTGNGIAMLYDELMQQRMPGDSEALQLGFKVRAQDRSYATYTAPAMCRDGKMMAFGNREDGLLLTAGEFAGDEDLRACDELVADGLLAVRDLRVLPDFVVDIHIAVDVNAQSVPQYRIRFEERRSYWKYHLLGNMNREGPYIVDLDNQVEFEARGEAVLPGNRRSRVFLSRQRVPVLEKSNYRFQLRERGNGVAKVLVKRLPVASESRLGREVIDGRNEIVLESYVNY